MLTKVVVVLAVVAAIQAAGFAIGDPVMCIIFRRINLIVGAVLGAVFSPILAGALTPDRLLGMWTTLAIWLSYTFLLYILTE